MKILYITPYAPTPIRTRPYNLIKSLVRNGHTVILASVWENNSERQFLDQLAVDGITVIKANLPKPQIMMNLGFGLIINKPLQSLYSYSPILAKKIVDFLKNNQQDCDIIHIEHLRGAYYGLHIKNNRHINPGLWPIAWDSVDNISALFEQASRFNKNGFGKYATRFEFPRTRKFEKFLLTQFDRILVTSALDKQAFERLHVRTLPESKISIVTNGVDLQKFSPSGHIRVRNQVVFSGKLSYHANTTAALFLATEIMPIIWSKYPSATLVLAGKDPPKTLLDLAQADARILVTGTVPDLSPYLATATVCAATLRYGAGVQNKVLEAMACGTPVVATPQAVAALEVVPGRDILVAEKQVDIANAILSLFDNDSLRDAIGENGRKYVSTHHNWDQVVRKLINIYEDINETHHRNKIGREAVSSEPV